MNYLLILLAGYGFGNRPASYITAVLIATLAGMVHPVRDVEFLQEQLLAVPASTPEPPQTKPPLYAMADKAALAHGIDPLLFRALIQQESAWNPNAVSPVGAAGLTQLMPATASSECGLTADERFDAEKNLNCGASYFAAQLRRFGAVDLALAAYNSGPSRVAKLGRIPRIRETQNYVSRIMANWQEG
jgi:soluble lytic murein transglycosylase-like protein